ncbi:hypothetical protein BC332_13269 [Capsicum chinense]|nr:hypothetical protein BC332_13269 [Capsicum chinense]
MSLKNQEGKLQLSMQFSKLWQHRDLLPVQGKEISLDEETFEGILDAPIIGVRTVMKEQPTTEFMIEASRVGETSIAAVKNKFLKSEVGFSLLNHIHLFQVDAMAISFKKVQIQRDDITFNAYVIRIEDAPRIVVLQELWGIDFDIKYYAQKISRFDYGFKALFPDLHHGNVGLDVAEAQHLMDGLDWKGVVKDFQASVNWLKSNGSNKVLGFICS